jgi:hypothetical protein
MNFSKLMTDLWLVGRRHFQPRILLKTKLAHPQESAKAIVKPVPKTPREERIDAALDLLKKAHTEAEQGRITAAQLADLRRRADQAIQNA